MNIKLVHKRNLTTWFGTIDFVNKRVTWTNHRDMPYDYLKFSFSELIQRWQLSWDIYVIMKA